MKKRAPCLPGDVAQALVDLFEQLEVRDIRVAKVFLPKDVRAILARGHFIEGKTLWGAQILVSPRKTEVTVVGEDAQEPKRRRRGTTKTLKLS